MITEIIQKILNNIWPMLVVFIVAIALIRFFYLQNHRERIMLFNIYFISMVIIWNTDKYGN